jgi:hypothetical protein
MHRSSGESRCFTAVREGASSYGVRFFQPRDTSRIHVNANARSAAWCAEPCARGCSSNSLAQYAWKMDGAAHSTNVWRRNLGPCSRQCTQHLFPLRSVTGARPVYLCRSAALV